MVAREVRASVAAARPGRPRAARRVFGALGGLFCACWAGGVLLFPLYKRMPVGYVPVLAGAALGALLCVPRVRRWCSGRLCGPSARRFLLAVVVLALALRAGAVLAFPVEPASDQATFHRQAVGLLEGRGYGHTAFYPPGMSLALAGWYWLTTAEPASGKVLNVLLGAGMVLLAWDVARRALPAAAGRWAAVAVAVMPTLVFHANSLAYELLLGCLLLGAWDLVLISRRRGAAGGSLCAAGVGLLLGAGSLVKPICLLAPALALAGWLAVGARWRAWVWAGLAAAVAAAVIAPWTVRNYREFGKFVLISTNGGVVLYAANNPQADGTYMVPPALPGELDEVDRDRVRRRQAIEWIAGNPAAWLRLAVRKVAYVWGTSTSAMAGREYDTVNQPLKNAAKAAANTFWTALLVVCVVATWRGRTWHRGGLRLGVLLVLYVFAIHLFFEAISRHQIPVIGVLVLIGSAQLGSRPAAGARPVGPIGPPESAKKP